MLPGNIICMRRWTVRRSLLELAKFEIIKRAGSMGFLVALDVVEASILCLRGGKCGRISLEKEFCKTSAFATVK
jgi:hypothetical protein